MGLSKENEKYIDDYWLNKKYRSGETDNAVWYSYASHVGKYKRANVLDELLVTEFSPVEVYLWTAIMSRIKNSKSYRESGVVYLIHLDYKDYCSNRVFGVAIRKFVKFGLLLDTLQSRWYIINPLYTSKFYKTVQFKE